MKTNNNQSLVNEEAFVALAAQEIPDDDIRRLVARMVFEGSNLDSLPPFVKTVKYQGVAPSAYNKMVCNLKIYEYCKGRKDQVHSVHTVPTLLQDTDVIICKDRLYYAKKGQEIKLSTVIDAEKIEDKQMKTEVSITLSESKIDNKENDVKDEKLNIKQENEVMCTKLGLYAFTSKAALDSVTATALAYVTSRGDTGLDNVFKDERKCRLIGIDRTIDAVGVRNIQSSDTKSSNLAREELFAFMMARPGEGAIMTDLLYPKLPYKVMSERVKTAYAIKVYDMNLERKADQKPLIKHKVQGYFPGCFKETITLPKIPTINVVANIMNVAEQTIGGSDKGRGAITGGYMYGELPSHITKLVNTVREVKTLLKYFGYECVTLESKRISEMLVNTLVANGVYVVSTSGRYILNGNDMPYGHYKYTAKPSLEVVTDPFTKPQFNSQGPIWSDKTFDRDLETFTHNMSAVRVTLTTMSPDLITLCTQEGSKFSMIPSLQPHKCKVWLVNRKVSICTVNEHLDRMIRSVWARVKFPFTRRPWYTADPNNGFFINAVRLLKVDRKVVDVYGAFFVEKSLTVEEMPPGEDIYDAFEDKKEYVMPLYEQASALWDHITSFKDDSDRFAALRDVLGDPDRVEMVDWLDDNEPEYAVLRARYDTYQGDGVVEKKKGIIPVAEIDSDEEYLKEPAGYGDPTVDDAYEFAAATKVQTVGVDK